MQRSKLWSRALVITPSGVLVACSSVAGAPSPSAAAPRDAVNEVTGRVSAAQVADATLFVRRADGAFDVRCANGRVEVAAEADVLADRVCLADTQLRCIPHCTARWSNGQCQTWGADYCAQGPASCVPQCTARWPNGQCETYGADLCAVGAIQCAARCGARFANGTCGRWDQDACAVSASPVTCVAHCAARYANGQCASYGEDVCSTIPLTSLEDCTARYANGQCASYGADLLGAGPLACVAFCRARFANGQCQSYGPDFCGAAPQILPSLANVARLERQGTQFDATCMNAEIEVATAADVLSGAVCNHRKPPTCVVRCVARFPNGQCQSYAEDFCVEGNAQCVAQCARRFPNGQCEAWGPDQCVVLRD
jgi:hypothetical protein